MGFGESGMKIGSEWSTDWTSRADQGNGEANEPWFEVGRKE